MTTFQSKSDSRGESGKKVQAAGNSAEQENKFSQNDKSFSVAHATPKGAKWVLIEESTSMDLRPDVDTAPAGFFDIPAVKAGMIVDQKLVKFRKGKSTSGMDLPPSLSLVPTLGHVFRFQSVSNSLTLVSAGNLLGSLGVMGTVTNTTVASLASSFKIHKLCVWPASGGTSFVEWAAASGYTKDEIKDSSLPSGVTVTKSLQFVPPRNSFAALWTNEIVASTGLFSLFAPTGSIIDLHVSYTGCAAFGANTLTVATAALGNVYYLALDGPVTNHFPSVGLPTTH